MTSPTPRQWHPESREYSVNADLGQSTHAAAVTAQVIGPRGTRAGTAVAALPQDAVEKANDGAETEASIWQEFGQRVADVVLGCSPPSSASPTSRKRPGAAARAPTSGT